MPRFKNTKGEYEYVDIIFNSSTMVNRENPGQIFELSLTHIGSEIIGKIIKDKPSLQDAYKMIHRYIELCAPDQAAYMDEKVKQMTKDELAFFLSSIIESGSIQLSMKPISNVMTIDRLNDIYKEFPWVEQNSIEVAIRGSDGNVRYVPARRKIVVGKQYIYRLKQFAEEKFSATSLSSTNIKNENTKSRSKKDYRELFSNTPIRFGNMETNNMVHAGVDVVISNLMIHSISPQGRRLVEQMYTKDPFIVDVKLDSDSSNRSAEIANTYLKTIGRRLVFIKQKKKYKKVTISPIKFDKYPYKKPIGFIPEELRKNFDYEKDFEERQELAKKKIDSKAIISGIRLCILYMVTMLLFHH